ncbi:HD family phosphohydrolase [Ruminiclostridium herbifermentans]|uniref:HD family phosphohydrolase n=1 Tax=Ruminiclostridium herbifermentans TaxID=2488810 RepID=A0A4U7JD14_9FIRM|nr:HD family phosphohydrolase [Ruminiclostridium herbifermentans]QNU67909.1 HD family phosphohydrolase [Ruminiclostridium herbifermentans]
MIELLKSKLNLEVDSSSFEEYKSCICELTENTKINLMDNFIQHSNVTCLEHSIYVSYISFLVCKRLKLDYSSAARGGLLHDFFLYDWHKAKQERGLHGFTHPYTALKNANENFNLNDLEKDIIVKHMWPLTIRLPKYKESFVVAFVDKYCALMEILKIGFSTNVLKLLVK